MSNQPKIKVLPNGTKEWCLNGELHRTDGPAIEWTDGSKEWWLNGELHRTDGPTIEWADGTKSWFLNGAVYSFEEYIMKLKALGKEETAINLLFELDSV